MKFCTWAILIMAGTLIGCTTYSDTLDQKLVGKSADDKRTVLAQECDEELVKDLKKSDPASVRHAENMKQICEEMTGKKIRLE